MKRLALLLVLFICVPLLSLYSQNYTIDKTHSAVLMKVQRFGVVNVIGRFGDIRGSITYDPEAISETTGDVSVTVASYTANNPGGEESAKGPAFLDGANHPDLNLRFKSVNTNGDSMEITADLTIKGTTQEVTFSAKVIGPKTDLPTRKKSIALSGVIKIQRLDFGVGPDRTLPDGTEIIGNEVSIMIEFLGIEE